VLKVGLVAGQAGVGQHLYDLVIWAGQQRNIAVSALVIVPRRCRIADAGPAGWLATRLLALLTAYESARLRRSALHRDHDRLFDVSTLFPVVITLDSVRSAGEADGAHSGCDLADVKALGCDLFITTDPHLVPAGLTEAARLGVLALRCGDDRAVGDTAPEGFWEWYYRWPKTGFVIELVADHPARASVLVRGFYTTQRRFLLNRVMLYRRASHHLRRLVGRVADAGRLPESHTRYSCSGTLPGCPTTLQAAHAFGKLAFGSIRSHLLAILGARDRWGLSFVHDTWAAADFRKSIEVLSPAGRSWDTPFVYTRAGRTYCFIEDDLHSRDPQRGRIAALELYVDRAVEVGICLEEPFHLAFPFVFEYDGSLYMCPEASESREVRVYRCAELPLRWDLAAVIMCDVAAVSTMLFEFRGKWWMLTNIDAAGVGDSASELYVFFADSPLETAWRAHPGNPVRIDSDGGRNAGLLVDGGRVFRLGQRHTFHQLRESIIVFEITALSEEVYAERPVGEIRPTFRKGLVGTHHCSSTATTTVVDHVSRAFFR
jgi:hypothetical protein